MLVTLFEASKVWLKVLALVHNSARSDLARLVQPLEVLP